MEDAPIRIGLVLERNVCRMCGPWNHEELQHDWLLEVDKEEPLEQFAVRVQRLTGVDSSNCAFFLLRRQGSPPRIRFRALALATGRQTALGWTPRSHLKPFQALWTPRRHVGPETAETLWQMDASGPYLSVLCIFSAGYDVQTLKWNDRYLSELNMWAFPDAVERWDEDQVILLVVRYFCPEHRNVVSLGCTYLPRFEPLDSILGWVRGNLNRLTLTNYHSYCAVNLWSQRHNVASQPTGNLDSEWTFWKEMQAIEGGGVIVSRRVEQPSNQIGNQFGSGDVIIVVPCAEQPSLAQIVTTVKLTQDGNNMTATCTGMSGDVILVLNMDPKLNRVVDIRAALVERLRTPRWRLQLVLDDGSLLGAIDDQKLLNEFVRHSSARDTDRSTDAKGEEESQHGGQMRKKMKC